MSPRRRATSQPVNQPTHQPVKPSTSQPVNQIRQKANQSTSQPVNQSTSQPMEIYIKKSINNRSKIIPIGSKITSGCCLGQVWEPLRPQGPKRHPESAFIPPLDPPLGKMEAKIHNKSIKTFQKIDQHFDRFLMSILDQFRVVLGAQLGVIFDQISSQNRLRTV